MLMHGTFRKSLCTDETGSSRVGFKSYKNQITSITLDDLLLAEERATLFVERLLESYVTENSYRGTNFMKLPDRSGGLIGIGENEAVIRLPEGNSETGWWAIKILQHSNIGSAIVTPGSPTGRSHDTLWETIDVLHSKELFAVIPPHRESCMPFGEINIVSIYKTIPATQFFYFTIAPDLSFGGQYQVKEAFGFDFSLIDNGDLIKQQFESDVQTILNLKDNSEYLFSVLTHQFHGQDPKIGVEKMFFVVVNPVTNQGTLVCGDLDHIQVKNLQRHENFINSFYSYVDSNGSEFDECLRVVSPRVLQAALPHKKS